MGAKPPAILKTRRTTCKCDVCGRGFLNVQSLRTHQSFSHPKSKTRVAYKPNSEVLAERNRKPAKVIKVSPKMPVQKKKEDDDVKETTKLEFGCPKCTKPFSAYFHAQKHIQKNHCVNSKGETVEPNSLDLIKPIRTEVCLSCNQQVTSNKTHKCSAKTQYIEQAAAGLKCLGCKKEFSRILLYDLHIAGIHSNDVQTMFFPTFAEFTSWKHHMESQMQCSHILISDSMVIEKSVHKRIYRCPNFVPNDNEAMAGFCPGSIIVQEYPKGYQIHFYKEHHGHLSKPYKLDEAYKKYSINYLMMFTDLLEPKSSEEPDMYKDFSKLMENIISQAEKADAHCLKTLFNKAQEMSVILNNRTDKEKHNNENKTLTDDEISSELNKVQTRSKRKDTHTVEVNHTPAKKIKKDVENDGVFKKNVMVKSPINFNDTFKDFVDNIACVETPTKKKEIVKTKIGQFKPSPTKDKKKEAKSEDVFDLYKVKSEFNFDISKVKSEFEYEVIEQENDCNILVLKI